VKIEDGEWQMGSATVSVVALGVQLGIRLKEEARTTFQWIRHNSQVPRLRAKGYHRVNLKVFPYYIA
jgi:hypothetical protein